MSLSLDDLGINAEAVPAPRGMPKPPPMGPAPTAVTAKWLVEIGVPLADLNRVVFEYAQRMGMALLMLLTAPGVGVGCDHDGVLRLAEMPALDPASAPWAILTGPRDERIARLVDPLGDPLPLKDPAVVRWLARDLDVGIRARAASSAALDVASLHALAKDPKARVRAAAAHNPNVSPELLDALAIDKHWRVRAGVASSKESSAELLHALLGDKNWRVRASLVHSRQQSQDDFEALARDPDERVRAEVAESGGDENILEGLARDRSVLVRVCVALNECTSVETRGLLRDDPVKSVRDAVESWEASQAAEWADWEADRQFGERR